MAGKGDSGMFADGDAYERYMGRWSRPVAERFVDWLDPPPRLAWVDVGCGTGVLTGTVLRRADPLRIVGVEPSEGYLAVARAREAGAPADFRQGDAQALPAGDREFDVAISGLVLNFVPNPGRALTEMRRVLKPGGTAAAYVWDYAGRMELIRFFWDAAAALFPPASARDEGRLFPLCQPEALAGLFRGAGLHAVQTCALDVPTRFSGIDDFWSPFLLGQGPAGAFCVSLGAADRERLRRRLEEKLPVRADGTIDLIARAWAVKGTV